MPPRVANLRGRGRGRGRGQGQGRGRGRVQGRGAPANEDVHIQPEVAHDQESHAGIGVEVPPGVANAPQGVEVPPGVRAPLGVDDVPQEGGEQEGMANVSQARVANVSQGGSVNAEDFMRNMAAVMMKMAGGVQKDDSISALTTFKKMNPPTFDGEADPDMVESFLSQCGRIFNTMGILRDEVKVSYTAFQLTGKASDWWTSIEDSQDVSKITWEKFKEIFSEQFFPLPMRDAKRDEFMNLIQGTMTVLEYERKFFALSKYAPEMVSTEYNKCRIFERGLRPAIRGRVVLLHFEDYKALTSQAMIVEKDLNDTR